MGHNPTKGIRAFRENRRERFLNSEELARLGSAIREAETVGTPYEVDETKPNSKHAPKPENRRIKIDPYIAAAFRLLILTGARLREILLLKWDYVDFERGLLLLPDSKTGRKAIVLNAPALAILKGLDQKGQYVIFSEQEDKPRADLNRPWRTISARVELNGVRIHDLRHTHASVGAGAGLGLPSRRRGTLPRQHPCRPQSCGGNRQNEGENNACRDEESSATAVLSNVEGAHLPFSLIDAVATVKEEDGPHPIFRKRHLMPLIRRSKHSWCVGFSSPPSR